MHHFEPDKFRYKAPICFHIPAIFDLEALVPYKSNSFYTYLKYSKYLRDNVFFAVYGCPCSCTWNGGRLVHEPVYSMESIVDMFEIFIKELGMDIQLTFTNRLLEEDDLYDRLGNALLKLVNEVYYEHVDVLISSDVLIDYIMSTYPRVKLTRSATMYESVTEDELYKFSRVVLPRKDNKSKELIKDLAKKVELEILCDEPCVSNCPRKTDHYEAYNALQLFENLPLSCSDCNQNKGQILYNDLWVLPEEINDYIDLGVRRFKLSGREHLTHMIESVSMYAIKNDRQMQFRIGGCYNTLSNVLYKYKEGHIV